MFGKLVIRLGDPTTHGGQVISASSNFDVFGKQVARIGDKVTCPQKGHGVCVIVEGDPTWTIDGRNVALEGHKTSCGATLISTLPNVTRSYEGMGVSSAGGSVSVASAVAQQTAERPSYNEDEPHALRFRALDPETGETLSYRSYVVTLEDGSEVTGTTDADGYTDPIQADAAEVVDLHVVFKAPRKNLDAEELT